MADLLIELFSEEIPARMQGKAADDLKKLVTDGLVEAGLTYASAGAFSTPRRLVLSVEGLTEQSSLTGKARGGPKHPAPDAAVNGFLRSLSVSSPDALDWSQTALQAENPAKRDFGDITIEAKFVKGKMALQATWVEGGRPAAEIVAETLEAAVRGFPWPKAMRWGDGSLRWVRPLQSILCLLTREDGSEIVPLDIDGIASGDVTQGHRFMAPAPFSVTSFEDYAAKLKRAFVVLDPAERAEAIWNDATNAAFAQGLDVVEDRGLLAEVAGLVEWPVVLMGDIGDAFLDLPPEVLQTSMREHQKFFSVRNPKTGRIEKFVTVANIETADDGAKILAGNQKVLGARLSDAKFFWENDLRVAKAGMDEWITSLEAVTFHAKLGSQAERVGRIAALAREIAPLVGADPDEAEQAARVAKADLASEMVYEFPELQGVMGRYYAKAAGLPDAVATASEEHYAPLGPSDDVPTAPVSVAVALADKIDTLSGLWAVDERPTGSKDPYALRRAALGIIRLTLVNKLSLGIAGLVAQAHRAAIAPICERGGLTDSQKGGPYDYDYLNAEENQARKFEIPLSELFSAPDGGPVGGYRIPSGFWVRRDILAFIHDRLKVHLRSEGIRHDIIDACLFDFGEETKRDDSDDLTLLVKRAKALQAVLQTEDGENLVQGFKRANNILSQAEEADGVEYSYGADVKFAEAEEEKALFAALDLAEKDIAPALEAQDFPEAMAAMAALREPIDAFFEAVKINADVQAVRRNRLNLLSRIRTLCTSVADLSRLDG